MNNMLRVFTISRPSLEELLKDVLKKKKRSEKDDLRFKKKKRMVSKENSTYVGN